MAQPHNRLIAFCAVSGIAACIAVASLFLPFVEDIENRTWDWRARATMRSAAPSRIAVITIDQGSLDYMARDMSLSWPVPRQVYGAVVDFLHKGGAKAVAFDLMFSEPSSYGVSDDELFARSLGLMPSVQAASLSTDPHAGGLNAVPLIFGKRSLSFINSRWYATVFQRFVEKDFVKVLPPIKEYAEHAVLVGNVSGHADRDGVYRRVDLGGMMGTYPILSFPFALHLAGEPDADYSWLRRFMGPHGQLVPRYFAGESSFGIYSLLDVLHSASGYLSGDATRIRIDPKLFEGAYVLIGATAPGLLDLRPTSVDSKLPGVFFHATVLDNILRRSFTWLAGTKLSVMLCLTLALVTSALTVWRRDLLTIVVGSALIAVSWAAVAFSAAYSGVWLPLVSPLAGTAVAAFAGLGYRYGMEGRAHRFVRKAFSQYVGREVIEQILRDPSRLKLGGERREITVLFSDLAGFTSLSERLEASQLVSLLNEYLSVMTEVILRRMGTLDKYVGDAIVCFWNAPIDVPDHAARAVDAAIECLEELDRIRPELEKRYGAQLAMRIGIATGEATVGNFGSDQRFDYTAIGDVVNTASRLEGANKFFGTSLLVGSRTRDLAGDTVFFRPVGKLILVGKGEPIEVFEPIAQSRLEREGDALKRFSDAYGLLVRRDPGPALRLLEECPLADRLSAKYLARLRALDGGDNGDPLVWRLDQK